MEENLFNKLIERYQQGLLTGREKQLMDEWFEKLGSNQSHSVWSLDDKQKLQAEDFV